MRKVKVNLDLVSKEMILILSLIFEQIEIINNQRR